MTNFVIGQTNICKSAKIDSLDILAGSCAKKLFTIISVIYKILKEKFIMAQVLLQYTANLIDRLKRWWGRKTRKHKATIN